MKRFFRSLLLVASILAMGSAVRATTYTSVASGDWATATTWSPNVSGGPTIDDVVIINNHTITSIGGSFTGWTGSASITINSGGSLQFSSSLSLTGTGVNIYVNTGGSLQITGTLSLFNQAEIAMQGGTLTSTNPFVVDGATYSSTSGSTTSVSSLSISNSGSTSFANGGSFTVTGAGNVTADGGITNTGTMDIGGNLNGGGGGSSIITNSGTMNISGSVDLPSSSKFYTNPGAVTTVTQNVTTTANQNLIVGTSPSPPPFADFIIKGNLISSGSGDVLVDTNGRLGVFGNFSSTGAGGSIFAINDGGQVYINGTITFDGGGDHLTNNNDGSPYYGMYSPNQPVYNGGGSSSDGAAGSNSVQDIATMQSENPTFFTWVASIPGSPLPVTILFIKIKNITSEGITLAWATASELNFDYFNVQRSTTGKNFETISKIKGSGTTNERHDYAFLDKFPISGRVYYRLQAIDLDGYTETFNVISATFEAEHDVLLYPVPVTDSNLFVHFNFESKAEILVSIINVSGAEMAKRIIKTNEIDVSLNIALDAGVYIIKMNSVDFNKVSRIVVK